MESLYNYLHQILLEVKFSPRDFDKDKYIDPVINDLMNADCIRLGNNGGQLAVLDKKEQNDFKKRYLSGEIHRPKSMDEFDKMVSVYSSFPAWREIFKGKYSGRETDTVGQIMEGLVCYMFNNEKADIDAWARSHTSVETTPDWIESCKMTVDFMSQQTGLSNEKWNRDNYVACRVDGGDFDFDMSYSFALEITSLFRGKTYMNKLLKINCNDLYTGQKDTWNKADIILIHKTKGKTVINDIKEAGIVNGAMLNDFLISKAKDGTIIPISLKKLSNPKAHLELVGFEKSDDNDICLVNNIEHIKIADKYQDDSYVGSMDIVCYNNEGQKIKITFRESGAGLNKNNLSVEPAIPKGSSRTGKAISAMKRLLGIKNNNSYYIYKQSDEEVIKELESYGFEVKVNPKSNYHDVTPLWRERCCVAGLLGLLSEYKNKLSHKSDKDFATQFANFCMMCSTGLNGEGAFYKISN